MSKNNARKNGAPAFSLKNLWYLWWGKEREKEDGLLFLCEEKGKEDERQQMLNQCHDFSIDLDIHVLLCVDIMTNHEWEQAFQLGYGHTHTHTHKLSHSQTVTHTQLTHFCLLCWSVWLLRLLCDCQIAGQHQSGSLMHFDSILDPLPFSFFLSLNHHFIVWYSYCLFSTCVE